MEILLLLLNSAGTELLCHNSGYSIFRWQKLNDIPLKKMLWFQETKVSFGWAHRKWCVKES